MTQRVTATISQDHITCVVDNRFRSIRRDTPEGKMLEIELKKPIQDIDNIRGLVDIAAYIAIYTSGRVILNDHDQLLLDGQPVSFSLIPVIKRHIQEGFNADPLARFLENVAENPNKDIAEHLYPFLETGRHPITDDGCFLAFKRVNDELFSFGSGVEPVRVYPAGVPHDVDHADIFTGKVQYPMGSTVEMDRDLCDPSRESACSVGLHACSFGYLRTFHHGSGRIILVKINPRDVTAFPFDHEAKLRCCRLEVIGEVPEEDAQHHFSTAVERRYNKPDAAPAPEPKVEPINWYDKGLEDGEAAGKADRKNGYNFNPAITWPDNIPADERPDYAEAFSEGYREGWEQAEVDADEEAEVPTPEEVAAEEVGPSITAAENDGRLDGREWAEGDTLFDADPTSGAEYHTYASTGDQRLENTYRQAFVASYTERFKEQNG